jgi:hypothetical protein
MLIWKKIYLNNPKRGTNHFTTKNKNEFKNEKGSKKKYKIDLFVLRIERDDVKN